MAIVIEMSELIHQHILKKGFLNMGWSRCKVFDYVKMTRCYKCWGFFHIAKYCKKDEVCGKCAGSHPTNDCNNDIVKCISCENDKNGLNLTEIEKSHYVKDKNCPSFKYFLDKLKRKILENP